jgi:two-component system sensor histidine kinase YesM
VRKTKRNFSMRNAGIHTNLMVLMGIFVLLPLCVALVLLCIRLQYTMVTSVKVNNEALMAQIAANENQMIETVSYTTGMFMVDQNTFVNLKRIQEPDSSYEFYLAQVSLSSQISMIESSILGAINGKIAIITSPGYLLSSANISPLQQEYKDTEWYQSVLMNGRKQTFNPQIANVFRELYPTATIRDQEYLYLGRSVYDYAGSELGVVIVQLSAENIWGNFTGELPPDASLAIIDSGGNIQMAYGDSQNAWVQVKDSLSLEDATAGSYFSSEVNGLYYSAVVLNYSNTILFFAQPTSSFYATTQLVNEDFWAIILVLITFTTLVLFFIAGRIAKPLTILPEKIDNLETDTIKIDQKYSTYKEINRLIASYNRAGTRIRELMENIRTESRLKEKAYYDILLSQISPHFIFNTINSIRYMALMNTDEQTADALEAFGSLLRAVYDHPSNMTVLGRELDILSSYVKIMRMRFGYAFEYINIIPAEYSAYTLPSFTLQPLVENAILHGVKDIESGQIIVSAIKENEDLVISVFNNGKSSDIEKIKQYLNQECRESHYFTGIGLYNINRRLRLLYGDSYGLQINEKVIAGFEINVRIPVQDALTGCEGETHVESIDR